MSDEKRRPQNSAASRRKRKKLSPERQLEFDLNVQLVRHCRANDTPKALECFWNAREAKYVPNNNSYGLLLAHCCGSDIDSIDDNLAREAVKIFRDAEECGAKLSESMMTSYLRACCHLDAISEAQRMVQLMTEKDISLKTRSLRPLLHYYARHGQPEECQATLKQMQSRGCEIAEIDYVFAFRGCVLRGAEAKEWFEAVFEEFSEDILRPSREVSWPVLQEWFEANSQGGFLDSGSKTHVLRVGETGFCEETDHHLRSVDLAQESKEEIVAKLEEYVGNFVKDKRPWDSFRKWLSEANKEEERANSVNAKVGDGNDDKHDDQVSDEGGRGNDAKDSDGNEDKPDDQIGGGNVDEVGDGSDEKIGDIVDDDVDAVVGEVGVEAAKREFDCLVDGANVGYFRGNHVDAPDHINYNQVDAMMKELRRRGRKSLLVLHRRHLSKRLMPGYATDIVKRWRAEELFYVVEYGNNDDWYWLRASLEDSSSQSAFPMWVVSNDLMRDHHFEMWSHRSFQRWRERHQVFYEMSGSLAAPVIVLKPPLPYSHRTQVVENTVYIPNAEDEEWLVARWL